MSAAGNEQDREELASPAPPHPSTFTPEAMPERILFWKLLRKYGITMSFTQSMLKVFTGSPIFRLSDFVPFT